jgi:3',5'-nucleoside bisphosphate phosphatase
LNRIVLAASAALMGGSLLPASALERAVEFPSTADGSIVLAADLHTHSVFSDGQVWPSIRVEEAHRDGLEVLAITEHLEHQPKKADIPHPDRNRSYEVAVESLVSQGYEGLLVINGAEVSRDQPHGHINAVFLDDANALLVSSPRAAIEAANKQGAFVFLNHPNWIPQAPDGIARLTDYHRDLIRDGLLHGVEVANGTLDGHSEHALQIALDNNLTVLGTSDIHGLVDWTHDAGHGGHRPMTLVLARDRSEAAMKTALFEGRTVAWQNDDLMGKPEHVRSVVAACLTIEAGAFPGKTSVLPVTIRNACPVNFTLRNTSEQTFQNVSDLIRIERGGETKLSVRMGEVADQVALEFEVLNAQVGYRKFLELSLSAPVPVASAETFKR